MPKFIDIPKNKLGETINKEGKPLEILKAIELKIDRIGEATFSKKYTLTFPIPTGVKAEEVTLYYFNPDSNKYEHVGGKINTDGLFEAELDHMSTFALAKKIESDEETTTETQEENTPVETEETTNQTTTTEETQEDTTEAIETTETIENDTDQTTIKSNKDEVSFKDLQNHWSKDYVMTLHKHDAVSGYADNTFGPDNYVTRAELVKIVLHAFDIAVDDSIELKPFKDVYMDKWYAAYIAKAKELDIVGGFSDGTFRPDEKITRAAAMKILALAADVNLASATNTSVDFKDVNQNDWYVEYLKYMVSNEIIGGYADNTVKPAANITRAELSKIAVMLMK
jgi:amidase